MKNKKLQVALNLINGSKLKVDGIEGKKTKTEVRKFQKKYGLQVDGIVGRLTTEKLEVVQTQILLNKALRNTTIKVDGIMGRETRKAVREFQSLYSLVVDGIVGRVTEFNLMFFKYPNFKKHEFACKCRKYCDGFPVYLDEEVLILLQEIRDYVKKPMIVTSGVRCKRHNRNEGGKVGSRHLKGDAVDFKIAGMTGGQLFTLANRFNPNGGVGRYNTFTHVDTRGYRSRW